MADLSVNGSFHENMEHFPFQNAFFEEQEEIIKLDLATRSPIEIMKDDFKNYLGFVKFGHVNAVTVPGNRDELVRLFNEIDFDIFAVSEQIFTKTHQNPLLKFQITGFSIRIGRAIAIPRGAAEFM